MKTLIVKDFVLTRWVHGAALALGLIMIPLSLEKPEGSLFAALFLMLIYNHLLQNLARPGQRSGAENLLQSSLPLRRRDVVSARYLFSLLCTLAYPLYLILVSWLISLFGTPLPMPLHSMYLVLVLSGLCYNALMLCLSFVSPRWSNVLGVIIYMALIILPQKLPQWLGHQGNNAFRELWHNFLIRLQGWTLPFLCGLALCLFGLSVIISQQVYQRADF